MTSFAPGDHVTIRNIQGGHVLFAWPHTVVEDADRGLLLELVPGAVGMVPRGYPGDWATMSAEIIPGPPTLVELDWRSTLTLRLVTPGSWWSARLFWDASELSFVGYYVDFVRTVIRDGDCLDSLDLALDVVVDPDGSWSWKDEHHVPVIRALGWLDSDAETALEAAKSEGIAAIEAKVFPFDGSLLDLRPRADASPAVLSARWHDTGTA